jgi:amino acid permease
MLYIWISISGYLVNYDETDGNVLNNFDNDDPVISVGRIALSCSLLLAFPLMILPTRASMHSLLVMMFDKNGSSVLEQPRHALAVRLVETTFLVVVIVSVGVSVDNVVIVWNFCGSTVAILVSLILPALFYLRIRRPTRQSSMTIPAYILLVFGVISLVLCTVGAIKAL